MPDIYIALIHYPIVNKEGRTITTSVTNFDIHDLARTARTYGVKQAFFVTPSEVQQNMIRTICAYWQDGFGATYNPDRKEALSIVKPSKSLEDSCLTIESSSGMKPLLLATTAKLLPGALSYSQIRRERIVGAKQPLLVAFGTGHGLAPEFFSSCDAVLEPIPGSGDYNHLPVRSAVAIILDRLLGER